MKIVGKNLFVLLLIAFAMVLVTRADAANRHHKKGSQSTCDKACDELDKKCVPGQHKGEDCKGKQVHGKDVYNPVTDECECECTTVSCITVTIESPSDDVLDDVLGELNDADGISVSE